MRSSDPSYDRVPYPQKSHSGAHIGRLEALATLFDMRPAPVSECRVLELGCAAGWNLIPQAYEFTGSEFIGVDASPTQIAAGRPLVDSLSLGNIELRQADILKIDASWGKFDYILCHGVYSWVPPEVQQQIMRICKENLAPDGVANVSYNVLPGWHFRGIAREMMLYHASQFQDPHEQLTQARAVLDFMADNCPQDTAYGQMLADELKLVKSAEDAYLFHDHLEDNNHPIYFHEFCRRAETEGLQYLSDISFADMLPRYLPSPVQLALANASLVKQEQYMDFLRNNSFRQSLLCHASQPLNRQLHARVLDQFHLVLANHARPAAVEFPINSPEAVRFTVGKRAIETDAPTSKAAIHELVEKWPHAVSLQQLQRGVEQRLAEAGVTEHARGEQLHDEMAGGMMEMLATGMLEFFVHPPTAHVGNFDRPEVSPLIRKQAELGPNVTTMYHRNVRLDNAARELVCRLDGTTDREELVATFASDKLGMTSPTEAAGRIANVGESSNAALSNAAVQALPAATEQIHRALAALATSGLLIER